MVFYNNIVKHEMNAFALPNFRVLQLITLAQTLK